MDFLKTISQYILQHGLLDRGAKHIVALSGGADSVSLLIVLQKLGYDIEAAHCNFHLRGDESDRDEEFVKKLCRRHGVALHIAHFDTKSYASLHKVSIEMAARTLRYSYFGQLRSDIGAATICVAHHRDDSAETLLINLSRGTGIHGLTGISPKNGNVVRPLLCVSRNDIADYLNAEQQDFVDDSTNFIDDVVRNKIRLNVVPQLKRINPDVNASIQSTAERVAEAAKIFDWAVSKLKQDVMAETAANTGTGFFHNREGVAVDVAKLMATPSPECLLYETIKDYGFSPAQISNIFYSIGDTSGKLFLSPSHNLLISRGRIVVEKREEQTAPMAIPEPGIYIYGGKYKFRFTEKPVNESFKLEKKAEKAYLDAAKLSFPLTIRHIEDGDRFVPFGMKGSKLVSDFLTDRKRSLFEKRRQLAVTDNSGRIVWLVCERPAAGCCVSGKTTNVVAISIENIDSHDSTSLI